MALENHQLRLEELKATSSTGTQALLNAQHQSYCEEVDRLEWRLEASLRSGSAALAEKEAKYEAELCDLRRRHEQTLAESNRTAAAQLAAQRAIHLAELDTLDPVIKNLMLASKMGNLNEHQETTDILTDISACLASGSKRGRQLSNASKTFYGMLLNSGSPYAHKFVSNVLFGESLRESQRTRSAFEHGLHEEGLVDESLKSLRDVQLKPYGLEDVPGIVSEDVSEHNSNLATSMCACATRGRRKKVPGRFQRPCVLLCASLACSLVRPLLQADLHTLFCRPQPLSDASTLSYSRSRQHQRYGRWASSSGAWMVLPA